MTDAEIEKRLDDIIRRYNAGAMPDGDEDLKRHLRKLIEQVSIDESDADNVLTEKLLAETRMATFTQCLQIAENVKKRNVDLEESDDVAAGHVGAAEHMIDEIRARMAAKETAT
jgi:hypothetical protein